MVIEWEYRMGGHGDTWGARLYRNDKLKAQKEVHTQRNKQSGKWGTGKVYYFLDGDKRTFGSEEKLLQAWAENQNKQKEGE